MVYNEGIIRLEYRVFVNAYLFWRNWFYKGKTAKIELGRN